MLLIENDINNLSIIIMILLPLATLAIVAGFTFWLLFIRRSKPRARGTDLADLRQAENKVKVSAPILRRDIDILDRYGSEVLQEAIELRRAQILRGDHPDSPGQP